MKIASLGAIMVGCCALLCSSARASGSKHAFEAISYKDLSKAIKKRKYKEEIYESLPKIDCGACGSPTCLTFAEDVVKRETDLSDCIFNFPKRFSALTHEMIELLDKSAFINKTQYIPKTRTKKKGVHNEP